MIKTALSILPIIVLFPFSASFSQKIDKQKQDSLHKAKIKMDVDFIQLTPSDKIADIGTGAGYSLIPLANHCPECKFAVEDIDSTTCNPTNLLKKINNSGNLTSIQNFTFYYGTEKNSPLPSAAYNKILIFDVVHELTYKKEILEDCKRILTPSGSIFIEEILVHKPVKKDKACNYPFFTEEAFKKVLSDNGLSIKRELTTHDTGNNRYIKLFECIVF